MCPKIPQLGRRQHLVKYEAAWLERKTPLIFLLIQMMGMGNPMLYSYLVLSLEMNWVGKRKEQ